MDKLTPEQIAKQAMDKINKDKKSKLNLDEKARKEAEAKGAAPASSPEKEKTEEEKSRIAQAEAQAKKDEELLAKKEEELTTEEKKRKEEILNKDKGLNEDKVDKRKQEIQAEIDKLISQKKALEEEVHQTEKLKEERKKLEDDLATLKKEKDKVDAEKNIPEEKKLLKQQEETRIKKYLDEDKELPREERRELPKEELDDWLLEDMSAASEWIAERSLRRVRERQIDAVNQQKSKFVKDILVKQEASNARVMAKHPELDTKKREAELKAEGKSNTEINDILCKENEKYRISLDIVKENPESFLTKDNGPELVAAEMEKRLNKTPPPPEEESEIEKLKAQLEAKDAEIARLNGVDETLGSSGPGAKPPKDVKKTEFELKQEEIAKRAGISPERLKAIKERREKIPGASVR